jgi:CHAT domain-containing protein/Tfp pilus assembly protein PilF
VLCLLLAGLTLIGLLNGRPGEARPPSKTVAAQLRDLARTVEQGGAASAKADLEGAEQVLQFLLNEAQHLDDRASSARILSRLGDLYELDGQFDKAVDCFTQALALGEALDDRRAIAANLENLGDVYDRLGQSSRALDFHTRALALREAGGTSQEIAASLGNLGGVYCDLGQFAKALDCHTRSLALLQLLDDKRNIPASLSNLGNVYVYLGQLDKALDCYTRALDALKALGNEQDILSNLINRQAISVCLNNLGSVYLSLGQFDRALDFHTRALTLREPLGNKQEIAESLGNLGGVYHTLGQFDKALDFLTRALALEQPLGNQQAIATTLGNLGNVYYRLGRLEKALEFHTRSLALRESLGNQKVIAGTLGNLGIVYSELGQLRRALEHHSRALTLREPLGDKHEIAESLANLGGVYHSLGQLDRALEFYIRSLALREPLGNKHDTATVLLSLAGVYTEWGRLDEAENALERARQDFEAVKEQVGDPSQLGAYEDARLGNLYARYAAILVRRHRPEEALAMAERGRAQGLARQIVQGRGNLAKHLSRSDAAQLRTRTLEMTRAGKILIAMQSRPEPKDPADKRAFEEQLERAKQLHLEAERRYSLLLDSLFARYPVYRQVRGQQPPTPQQLAALARRNPDTLFLEWVIVDAESTLLFALSQKEGLKSFLLPLRPEELTARVRHFWTAAASQRGHEPAEAAAVYRVLFAPLEQAGLLTPGRYFRLVLVGDGPLLELPWAALVGGNGKRLIERYALSTSVSLGALNWQSNPRVPSATILCAVDPAGSRGEQFPVARRGSFTPLKHAREEAKKVAQLFPRAVGLAGSVAREGRVKAQMGRFALLHFATHGILDSENGLRSWLLLAPEPKDSKEDGRLEGREIVGLPLAARLAVLSACETGRGQASGGEGLLGLAWAFRAAGCPSIVASQWKVDDRATGKLMVAFYRALKAGQRMDEALRQAMLAVKQEAGYSAPFYWAGFQVIGDTAPLSLPAAASARISRREKGETQRERSP